MSVDLQSVVAEKMYKQMYKQMYTADVHSKGTQYAWRQQLHSCQETLSL
jgi:hypothetical protein